MRARAHLLQCYRTTLSYTGLIFLLSGLLMLTPLFALTAWPREWVYAMAFVVPALLLVTAGSGMWRIVKPEIPVTLTVQDGGVIVLLSWVTVCLFSAWPYITVQKLSFTSAIFESVSGWTTTGLSVVDVSAAPHLILLWRSITQLAGGAGLAIIMLAAIAGPPGAGLSAAEGRTDQLVPHVRQSAKLVLYIYSGYAVTGSLAYWLAGMTPFDAINHAFAAVSTGGFSTHPESIAYWDSALIEMVTLTLMILGNLNFLTAYLFLHGKFRAVCRNGEVRLMTVLIPVGAFLLFMLVCKGVYPGLDKTLRVAIFETTSALTTTGFSTTEYGNWNAVGFLVLTVLMMIGGGTCSTAGGIKQYRIYLLFKSLLWELRRPFLPRTAVVQNYVWQGELKDFISDARIRQVAVFLFLYLAIYFLGSGIIAGCGYGLKESLFEFASALSTVGLSVGLTNPAAPPVVLWTETLGMFLGRLEFFTIIVSLVKIGRDSVAVVR
jgi:trk system potassium uptake protein TrkH